MPIKPVDTAIKVIVGPLIDDTDFKSREESVAYDAAGMEIDVIVEKADGTITTTAVTPTTSGDYDWAHTDQGYYELELPASGGASFNNAEEGMLTVVGYATGVLPFRSQSYDIVPVKVYNSLVKGTDNLEVDQIELGGSTQSATDLKDFADTGYDPTTHRTAADLMAILGHLLTQTGTQLADGFEHFFDVATPAVTVADAMRGTDNAALAATALSNVTWTDARAGCLDKLNVSGTLAHTDNADSFKASGFTTYTVADIADAVWDEALAEHTTSTTFGGKNQLAVPSETIADYRATGFSTATAADIRTEIDNNSTQLAAIVADTNELQTNQGNWLTATGFSTHNVTDVVTAMQGVAGDFKADVSALPTAAQIDTELTTSHGSGTWTTASDVTLTPTERNAVADAVLGRSVSNVEAAADEHSLCTVVLATLESSVSGTTWTIAQTDGSTEHASKTVTLSAGAYPITGVS